MTDPTTLYEVRSLIPGGRTRFAHTVENDREDADRWRCGYMDGEWGRPVKANVLVSRIAAEAVASLFKEGQSVLIRKYGSWYHGVVAKVGRKRITVRFRTVAGKEKEAAVPAYELRIPS